jgi:hypothetical protein
MALFYWEQKNIMIKNKKCINCDNFLERKQRKYCSEKCKNFWRNNKNESRKKYQKKYFVEYYKKHREEIIEKSLEYNKNNKEEKQKYLKKYVKENKETIKETKKQYYIKNNKEIKKQRKDFRENNKEKIREQKKKYKEENREKIKEANRKYCENNKEEIRRKKKIYKEKNRERLLKVRREKERELRKNPIYRAGKSISKGIYDSLRSANLSKNKRHWEDITGYTYQDLKKHLENLFQQGMSWDNYGYWHIDHIIPQSFFKFKSINDVEFKYCWSLNNLQPLWAEDNLKKGKRLTT